MDKSRQKITPESREAGLFNLGGCGTVAADGVVCKLDRLDCNHITQGAKVADFTSGDTTNPAKFYCLTATTHRAYETYLLTLADAATKPLGSVEQSNKRVIDQFTHPDVLPTANC